MDDQELRRAALAALILEQQQEEIDRARRSENQLSNEDSHKNAERVRAATCDTYTWLTQYTRTFNPHWKDQKLASPHMPFPDWPFFPTLLEFLEEDDDLPKLIEKSRTMMVTWGIMGYFTLQAMIVPEREIVIQTMTSEKGEQPIEYAKHLYLSQPQWLRDEFPLQKPMDKQAMNELRFANGSVMFGIPAGKGKIRSYHPWGFFSDETAFQEEAGDAYDEALSACKKIVLNSTAAPGWYFDFLDDVTEGLEGQ